MSGAFPQLLILVLTMRLTSQYTPLSPLLKTLRKHFWKEEHIHFEVLPELLKSWMKIAITISALMNLEMGLCNMECLSQENKQKKL